MVHRDRRCSTHYMLIALLAFCSCISQAHATRQERFIDPGLTYSIPGCSANYNAPCSFNLVNRLVKEIAKDILNVNNDTKVLEKVNSEGYDPVETSHFHPYVFDAVTMECVASARNASFIGKTIEEIVLELNVPIRQEHLSEEFYNASLPSHHGWLQFIFLSEDFEDDPVTHLAYVMQAQSSSGKLYVIMSCFAQRTATRVESESCPYSVNRRCSLENALSLVGNMIYRAITVESTAQLRILWEDATFPQDAYLREGNFYNFMFGFGNSTPHYSYAHIRDDWIGLSIDEISQLFVSTDIQNGTLIHENFANGAKSGGAWVDYTWTTSDAENIAYKVSYVAGLNLFGSTYYVGAGFNHERDDEVHSALCETCSTNYSEPCSIGNALSLSAHAEVELLANGANAETFQHINSDDIFTINGGFGVLIVDYQNGTVMSDSAHNSTIGQDVGFAFSRRHITNRNISHALLKSKASSGSGWIRLPTEPGYGDYIAMVSRLSEDNEDYYVMTGYLATRAPTVEICSAMYSGSCSAVNTRALVGEVVTALQTCSSDAEFQIVLDEINMGVNSSFTVQPNFYAHVLDEDFNLIAFGDSSLWKGWSSESPESFLTYVREAHSVTSVGEDFLQDMKASAFEQGGGFVTVEWVEAGSGASNVTFFSLIAQHTNDYGVRKNYYVSSWYFNADPPTLCSDGCQENSYCVSDGNDGLPGHCECGFYYVEQSNDSGEDTCSETTTSNPFMTCAYDPDKETTSKVKTIARALGAINCIFALGCIVWTIYMRNYTIVKASQPLLLVLVGVGTIVSSMTIFAMTIDDIVGPPAGDGDNNRANGACIAQTWFYGIGFAITYCSMIVKLRRVGKIFQHAAQMKKARGVSMGSTFASLLALLSVEVIVLIVWTSTDTLRFVRPEDSPLNGACESSNARAFVIILALYHLLLLLYGARLSYRCRKVNGVFAETKYLSLAMIGNLQVLLLALPVIVLTADDAATSMFIRSIAVFINDFSTTALIFCPKMYFNVFGPPDSSGAGTSVLGRTTTPKRRLVAPIGSHSSVGKTDVASTRKSTTSSLGN